jgi:nitroreductase
MNQVIDNIKSRRSKRSFLDKNIPDNVIHEIIEAGCYAPSALNKQPWKFIVITNKATIQKLSYIARGITYRIAKYLPILKFFKSTLRDPQIVGALKKTASGSTDTVFYNAPLLIIITSYKKEPYAVKDCALASQNMMLYANSVGLSSCYIGRAEILEMSRTARGIIGLQPGYIIQSAIVFGYASRDEDTQVAPARRKDNIINWMR